MANGVEDRTSGSRDRAKVVGERKDGPLVVNGAEVGVASVGELAVRDELSADSGIGTALVGQTLRLRRRC